MTIFLRKICRIHSRRIVNLLYVLLDYAAIISAEHTSLWLQGIFRTEAGQAMLLPWEYQYVYIPSIIMLSMLQSDCYRFNRPSLDMVRDVFKGGCFGFLMYMLLIFLVRNSMQISRYYALCFLFFMLLYITVLRSCGGKIIHRIKVLREPILLAGAGKTAERLLAALENDQCYCYRVVGILDDHPVSEYLPKKYPILGGLADLAKVLQKKNIRTLLIAAPGLSEDGMRRLLTSIQHLTDTVLFTPGLVGIPMGSVEISTLFVEQLTLIKSRNNLTRRWNRIIKFTLDMIVTLCGTLAILPLLLLLMLVVGIDNGGRIFFAHRRVGRSGKEFSCYKFCTMVPDADRVLAEYLAKNASARQEWEESFKLADDPRVTRLGAFLRRTSLDELPQVFNVLRGEMSLVGPRPIVRDEVEKYGKNIREYYMVRPGITGMWQTSGRSNTTYEERVAMDTWYVRNWSIWLDIKYLCRTFSAVIKRDGAY